MLKQCVFFSVLIVFSLTVSSQKIIDYVNPFIGTGGHGHTYPGATLPFGMVQLSPDNGTQGWDWSSGYNYSDNTIAGFSHTHLSGTGIGDLCDISVMPITGRQPDTMKVRSSFSHADEKASPGYYSVRLRDFNVQAELTSTVRCGMHKYTFPASNSSSIRFDLGFAINWDKTTETYFRRVNDSTFVGHRFSTGWAKNQKVFFAVRISKPIKSLTIFADKKKVNSDEVKAKDLLAYLNFNTSANEVIYMTVGLSFADIEGAVESLNEIRTWDFNAVRKSAEETWERELRKIQVNTSDEEVKKTFYTALYHTYLAPIIFSDRFGNYKGVKGDVKNGKMIMTVQSLWDTFRAANPLLTITQTELVPAIINSYLAFYDQNGLLPVWDLQFNETNTMTGYHAVPVIADAIMKDIKGFDYEKAYTAMKASAMQNIRGADLYRQSGFLPSDKSGESVTITLEYAFDDWCIAQVAKKLGKTADAEMFSKRAQSWKNLFDKNTGFMRGKKTDGKWVEPFDPYQSEHDGKSPYTEGNAWQHSFFVPHDVEGLKRSFTNEQGLMNKLDSLFTTTKKITGKNISPDISGLIGQYAHGNEPSHHIAYMYNFLQKPAKTAERVREIMNTMYSTKPDGLSGNEDCGQMSAWYVFSALGFYPVNPASGQYVIGSPIVDQSIMFLPGGKSFRVLATNNSDKNIYIQSATLNGKPYSKNYITHQDIMNGGVLELTMGNKAGKKWGTKDGDVPASMTVK
jgi:predicted alpha-1,2-mannosidase